MSIQMLEEGRARKLGGVSEGEETTLYVFRKEKCAEKRDKNEGREGE